MNQRGNKTDDITEDNVRRILTAFTPILRKKNKTVVTDGEYVDTFTVDTDKMGSVSIGIGALRHSSSIFYSQDWDKEKVGDEKDVLKEIIDDESLPRSAVKEVNPYLFKTPLDVVITSSEPERKFVEQLCRKENAGYIDSWVKSRDQGFYEIDYSYRYGMPGAKTRKYKIGKFNPDFFIRVNKNGKTYNIVVEIKEDNDVSEENVAKYKYALRHFAALNKKVRDQEYIFHFLSPDGYPAFFSHMQEGSLFEGQEKFRCNLENALEREMEGEAAE